MFRPTLVSLAPLAAAALFLLPATAGAQTARTAAPGEASAARKGWDGTVKGGSIVTPVEIGFELASDRANFAAGRLPIAFVLRNAASGASIRIAPETVSRALRPGADRNAVTLLVAIDARTAPPWDAEGCAEVWTSAENGPGGIGAVITLTFAACGSPQAAALASGAPVGGLAVKGAFHSTAARTTGGPIGGIIVKGGRNAGAARTAGNPIGGIIVKGGRNAGAARTAGNPIGGIIVKGGKNPGGAARTAGNPIGGIIVKGGKNPGGALRIVTGTGTTGTGPLAIASDASTLRVQGF